MKNFYLIMMILCMGVSSCETEDPDPVYQDQSDIKVL